MAAQLLDMNGVLYQGEHAVPGASEAVLWLREQRIPHLFLTNTTSRPRSSLVEKLAGLGIRADAHSILTPPVAAVEWLRAHAPGPAAFFVPEATASDFEALPLLSREARSGAASVVVGDLGSAWDFDTLNRAFRLLMDDPCPVLVALGMTRYWRAHDGLRLDVAPFIAALECATGARAVVIGKPARPFFEVAMGRLHHRADEVVMIGDDIVGDVEGAQRSGIRGVLVRTGKFRESDLEAGIRPDAVLDSIDDLPSWWQKTHDMSLPRAPPLGETGRDTSR
jgi:phospholysine phosphohistidine inorganic pyrophosphate phosphatase